MQDTEISTASEWTRACSEAFVPLSVRRAAPDFSAFLTQIELAPGVTVSSVKSSASDVVREPRLIRDSPREDIILSLHRTGSGYVTQHDRRARLTPGSAALYETTSPYTLSFPAPMSEIVLQLPRSALALPGRTIAERTANTLTPSGSLRALAALLGSVDAGSGGGDGVAESVTALLKAALNSPDSAGAPPLETAHLLIALRLHADDRCTDPEFSPETLAHDFHISLRYTQKLFASEDDSPAAYIRRRRLEHAHRLLTTGSSVARAAHASGFFDVDTFSRAFKREYRFVPSEIRSHIA